MDLVVGTVLGVERGMGEAFLTLAVRLRVAWMDAMDGEGDG